MTRKAPAMIGMLLAALIMRLLVPTGYMLDARGPGGPAIVPCSGSGPLMTPPPAMPGMHHGSEHGRSGDGHSVCPYAAAAAPAAPPSSADVAPSPAPVEVATAALPPADDFRPAPAVAPPLATGPPLRS